MIKIEVRGIESAMRDIEEQFRDHQERVMDLIHEEAPRFTPKRTGRAAGAWEKDVRQGAMEVINRTPYVGYLELPYVKSKQAPKGIIGPTLTSVKRKFK
jgi:hypothetical protein